MEIQPREIYNQSVAHYQFITRLKLYLSMAFFAALPWIGHNIIILINIVVSAINCLLIIALLEMLPRLYRDSLHNKDDKYAIPKLILDFSSAFFLQWLFISTAIAWVVY